MQKHPKKYKEACKALEAFLLEAMTLPEGYKVSVYAFQDKGDGFRIAEVDVDNMDQVTGLGDGCAFMRCDADVHTCGLILACEDFVRTYRDKSFRPDGWQSEIDNHADAKFKLTHVVRECMAPANKS